MFEIFVSKYLSGVSVNPGGGGYFWELLVGVYSLVLQILTLFQTKKCTFPHPFSDQTFKIHICFQTWPLGTNYVIINLSTNKKILQIHFGIERINVSIHSHSSRKTIPNDPDQNGQSIYLFSGQNSPKTLPDGEAHTYIAHMR